MATSAGAATSPAAPWAALNQALPPLLLSPDQRRALERSRDLADRPTEAALGRWQVQGIVQLARDKGRQRYQVRINGRWYSPGDEADGAQVVSVGPRSVQLHPVGTVAAPVRLHVGQTLDGHGTVHDPLRSGHPGAEAAGIGRGRMPVPWAGAAQVRVLPTPATTQSSRSVLPSAQR